MQTKETHRTFLLNTAKEFLADAKSKSKPSAARYCAIAGLQALNQLPDCNDPEGLELANQLREFFRK